MFVVVQYKVNKYIVCFIGKVYFCNTTVPSYSIVI